MFFFGLTLYQIVTLKEPYGAGSKIHDYYRVAMPPTFTADEEAALEAAGLGQLVSLYTNCTFPQGDLQPDLATCLDILQSL